MFFSSLALSNESLFGSWETEEGKKMDIIDGFKPNVGPVIIYEDEEITDVDSWKIDPNTNDLQIKYSSGEFTLSQNVDQLEWNWDTWRKIKIHTKKNARKHLSKRIATPAKKWF